jgi:hypothetical protein
MDPRGAGEVELLCQANAVEPTGKATAVREAQSAAGFGATEFALRDRAHTVVAKA